MKRMDPKFTFPAGPIPEPNVEHPAFQSMEQAVSAEPDKTRDYAELLYCRALLMTDLPLEDPMAYTELVCKLMK